MLKNIILTLLMIAAATHASAQNINKKYYSRITDQGYIYFVKPRKMPREGKVALKDMVFDITCASSNDSASFTATIITAQPMKENSVTITEANGKTHKTNILHLFTDADGHNYKNRVRFYLSMAEAEQLYEAPSSFKLSFEQGPSFFYPAGKWKKEQKIVPAIFTLYELNKKI